MSLVNIQGEIQSTPLNNNFNDLQNQINTTNTDLINHKNSDTAHSASDIVNTSNVAGAKVKDALNTLKNEDDTLHSRIDNIIAQSGTSDTEVVDARNSSQYGTYSSLNARLEGIETRSKYFAREEHNVAIGNNQITLTNIPENNHELLIYDKKYGVIWEEGVHWNRSGQIITFTSNMPEDLDFKIYILG